MNRRMHGTLWGCVLIALAGCNPATAPAPVSGGYLPRVDLESVKLEPDEAVAVFKVMGSCFDWAAKVQSALEALQGVEPSSIKVEVHESRQLLLARFRVASPATFNLDQTLKKIRLDGYEVPQSRLGSAFPSNR